jgi:hypothetical protein
MGDLCNSLGRMLGIKVSTSQAFEDLQGTIQSLRSQLHGYEQRALKLHSELVATRAHAVQLGQSLSTLSNTISRHTSQLARNVTTVSEPRPGRPVVVVLVSEVSQLPHLRAMISDAEVRARYRFVICTEMYVETQRSELLEFCRQYDLSMFSDFDVICGSEAYIRYEEAEDAASSFGMPLDLQAESADARVRTEAVDQLLKEIRRVQVYARRCQRLLQSVAAQLLILFEDNAEVDSGIWVAVAKSGLVPSAIIPVTISDQTEPAEYHGQDSLFWFGGGPFDRIIGHRFPHWLHQHKGRWLRRRLPTSLLALETLGFAQPAPWILNSSKASAIAVESPAMMDHYTRLGFPPEQLHATGSFVDDRLYEATEHRAQLRQKLSLDDGKPVLLCAFPPDHVGPHRPACEFASYREFIDFWLGELAKLDGWQIIVRPHPACRAGDVEHMRSFPVIVSALDTSDLIPLCDLYNASVSSTIRWALACGKPVLNYDAYQFGYSDFTNERAVVSVSSRDAFSSQLRHVCNDPQARRRLEREAELSSPRWGRIDGQTRQRIFALFDRLMHAPI